MNLFGLGIEKNEIKAFEIFKELSEKKSHYGFNGLGYMYIEGLSVK